MTKFHKVNLFSTFYAILWPYHFRDVLFNKRKVLGEGNFRRIVGGDRSVHSYQASELAMVWFWESVDHFPISAGFQTAGQSLAFGASLLPWVPTEQFLRYFY